MSEQENNIVNGPGTETPGEEPAITLTQNGVLLICQVIAAATARGAIRAEELSIVGKLYDQLRASLPPANATGGEETNKDAEQPELNLQ